MRKFKLFLYLVVFILLFIFVSLIFCYVIFPKKYNLEIETYSKRYNLEKTLIQSVIKVESGYDKNAKSTQGALGLMQILPSTAYEIANKLDIDNFNEEMLTIPEINIQFGCFYLRYLINYYDGNVRNAICAYNAGLQNVNNWLEDKKYSENNKDLTRIPFRETDNYLKKVNVSIKFYKALYKYI